MAKKFKIIVNLLLNCIILLFLNGCGESRYVDIRSEEEIKEFISGKWNGSVDYSGTNIFYRFLVTENQIKIWKTSHYYGAGVPSEDWKETPDEVIDYTIGPLEKESHGNRYRILGKCEYGYIQIRAGNDSNDNDGWFKVGNIEYNYYDKDLTLYKGWKN
jgi:hypothetical protein